MLDILKKIEEHGFVAYFVGGYPRDKYMNIETDDYDICTNATPEDLNKIFDCDMRFSRFGNVRVNFNNKDFEITTFRKDISYKKYRHPKVTYVASLEEDLKRRDFTINTLCIDADGNYVDLMNARGDIDLKVIKTVGDSDLKIEEDALRIIRAIRFSVNLGFTIDKDLEKSIIKYKDNLKYINPDKIKIELNKVHDKELLNETLKKFDLSNL